MWRVRASPIRGVALLGLALLVLAGCGGHKSESSTPSSSLPGAKVFDSAGCGGCHSLQAAKSKGTVGPDLDQLRPDAQTVERQVRNGGVGMPSFSKKLNEVQISQVAEFVSESTRSSTMGGSVAAGFKPDDTKIEDCEATDFHCYEQAFANISYKDSPKTALDLFDKDIKTPGPIERDCHRIAHAIGAAPPATTTASSNAPSSASTRASSAPRPASSAPAPKSANPSSSPTNVSTASDTGS
jgi:mono/diheme cytochrome c family protein